MRREVTINSDTPLPKGYSFLPKGMPYKTLHCRKRTHEAGKPLYVVVENKKQIGLRVPTLILHQVHALAKQTLSERRAATKKRDATEMVKVADELGRQFPSIPDRDRARVLEHGFKKHSGRVGRTGRISLQEKVLLAVIAHIRHQHTTYDSLLRDGKHREAARRLTGKEINPIMRKWGFKKGGF